MKYLLINMSDGNLQIDLFQPREEVSHKNVSLHRPGPVAAINIQRGTSFDLMTRFPTLAQAHAAVKNSKDTLKMLKPGVLSRCVMTDNESIIENVDTYLARPLKSKASKVNKSTNKVVEKVRIPEPILSKIKEPKILELNLSKAEIVESVKVSVPSTAGSPDLSLLAQKVVLAQPIDVPPLAPKEDITVPAMEVSAAIATVHEFERRQISPGNGPGNDPKVLQVSKPELKPTSTISKIKSRFKTKNKKTKS